MVDVVIWHDNKMGLHGYSDGTFDSEEAAKAYVDHMQAKGFEIYEYHIMPVVA